MLQHCGTADLHTPLCLARSSNVMKRHFQHHNSRNFTTPETLQTLESSKLCNSLQPLSYKPLADAQAWSHQLTWNSGLSLGSPHLEELNGQFLHPVLCALEAIIIILFHKLPSCFLCLTQALIFWGQLVEDILQTRPEEFGIC